VSGVTIGERALRSICDKALQAVDGDQAARRRAGEFHENDVRSGRDAEIDFQAVSFRGFAVSRFHGFIVVETLKLETVKP